MSGRSENMSGIDDCPAFLSQRSRLGDWETSTVIGGWVGGGLVSDGEYRFRRVVAHHIRKKKVDAVAAALTRMLLPQKSSCHTITLYNGNEFACDASIAALLQADIYFTHSDCAWTRGLNETSVMPSRNSFLRGQAFATEIAKHVQHVVERLKHRPHKVLRFTSQLELMHRAQMRYTAPTFMLHFQTESSSMMSDQARENQYQAYVSLRDTKGFWRLGIVPSRYKLVAKMLAGKARILEAGVGDSWASRLVKQKVDELVGIGFGALFVEDAVAGMDEP